MPTLKLLFACGLVALTCTSSFAEQTPSEVFASDRENLLRPGLHESSDFVFASVRVARQSTSETLSEDLSAAEAELRATRDLLRWRINTALPLPERSASVREAAQEFALANFAGKVVLRGVQTVYAGKDGEYAVCVQAIPESALRDIPVPSGPEQLLDRLAASPSLSGVGAMLLAELGTWDVQSVAAGRARAQAAMVAAFGPGISWFDGAAPRVGDNFAMAAATELWRPTVAGSVLRGMDLTAAFSPADSSILAQLGLEQLMAFVGRRAGDAVAVHAAVRRLRAEGWERAAALMGMPPTVLPSVSDHPGTRLPMKLRADVASTPVVALLLLSDGRLEHSWNREGSSERREKAQRAFETGKDGSVEEAIGLAAEDVREASRVQSLILLGAALVARGDAGLAVPICRAAYRAQPSDRYAGVNLVRALRCNGLKDEVRSMVRDVRSTAASGLDGWGRSQLDEAESWASGQVPVEPPKD